MRKLREWSLTTMVLIVAVIAVIAVRPAANVSTSEREEQPIGTEFYPAFDSPMDAEELRIDRFDPETATVRSFIVGQVAPGDWRIRSHFGYPVEAGENLAAVATGLIGIRRQGLASLRASDHERFGVLDPLDDSLSTLGGYGVRLTMTDARGETLADYIVGNTPENVETPNLRYVRLPKGDATYIAEISLDIPSRFADWTDTNLLRLDRRSVTEVLLNRYRVVPQTEQYPARVADPSVLRLSRDSATSPLWQVSRIPDGHPELTDLVRILTGRFTAFETLPEERTTDANRIRQLLQTLAEIELVAVRPKPGILTADLALDPNQLPQNPREQYRLVQQLEQALGAKGYYIQPLRDGRRKLFSSEGQITVTTASGVVYTLSFGAVFGGDPIEIDLGRQNEVETPTNVDGIESHRYLFVTIDFDPGAVAEPPGPIIGDVREEEIRRGREQAAALRTRFAPWYYVVSAEVYERLRVDLDDLTTRKLIRKHKPAEPREPLVAPRP